MKEKMAVNKKELLQNLAELGVENGAVLLVHSSLSKMGFVEGGADTFIEALLEAAKPDGTIMVPTLTGSEKLNKANPPVFEAQNTPCWTGKIPETFRLRKDAKRSLHPTHSVSVIGKLAEYFIFGHEDSPTPCGKTSPYGKLTEKNGRILFVGTGLACCTYFHTLEEIAGSPYHLQPEKVRARILTKNGEITRELFIHKYGTKVYFEKVEPLLTAKGALKKGKLGEADAMLLDTKKTAGILLPLLEKDGLFFTRND